MTRYRNIAIICAAIIAVIIALALTAGCASSRRTELCHNLALLPANADLQAQFLAGYAEIKDQVEAEVETINDGREG